MGQPAGILPFGMGFGRLRSARERQSLAYDSDCSAPAEFNLTRHAQEGRNTLEIVVSAPSQVARLESWKSDPAPAIGPAWVMSQPTLRVRDVLTKSWRSSERNDKVMAEIALVVKTEPSIRALHASTMNCSLRRVPMPPSDARTSHSTCAARTPCAFWPAFRQHVVEPRTADAIHAARKTQHEGATWVIELPPRIPHRRTAQRAGGGKQQSRRTPHARGSAPVPGGGDSKLREQGFNTLRLLPGPVSPALYAVCDTMGMYVIPQAPDRHPQQRRIASQRGNPSNDPAWQNAYVERTEKTAITPRSATRR